MTKKEVGFALGLAIRILGVENFVEKSGNGGVLLVGKGVEKWVERVDLIKRKDLEGGEVGAWRRGGGEFW